MGKSQFKQDEWVVSLFPSGYKGFFVEIGAKDGVHFSNTYMLEKKFKWTGLCIEPNPKLNKDLAHNRNCKISHACVDGYVRQVKFWNANDGQGGIIIPGETLEQKVIDRKGYANKEVVPRVTTLLKTVFKKQGVPHIIDYFSLDIEGSEERVLKPFPFEKYQFRAMTIERPSMLLQSILSTHGYKAVKTLGPDTCYVNEDLM